MKVLFLLGHFSFTAHGHSVVDTYGQFFGHLSQKFIDCNSQQLTLDSDDELAVRKCFKHFFPRAATVACSRHLKENVTAPADAVMLRRRSCIYTLLIE
jgi:hypothetical protein